MARARSSRLTIDDVRAIALALPDTSERPSYGTPGFRVKDKLFSRVLDDDQVVVKVDLAWRDEMVASAPDALHVTPHYQEHPWVIVRLPAVDRARLTELLVEAHQLTAPAPARPRASKKKARPR